jgi:hypothetical protein
MPVAETRRLDVRSFLAIGLTVLTLGLLLGAMFLYLAENTKGVRLGDTQFNDLNAERTARRITTEGPIQFPDVSGGNRVINVSHVGESAERGWYVFDAIPAGSPAACVVDWNRERKVFVDRCNPANTFPITGEGLRQYAVRVDDKGKLIIDFNVDPRATTTLAPAGQSGAPK